MRNLMILVFGLFMTLASQSQAVESPSFLRLGVDTGIIFRDSYLSCIDFMNREATGQNIHSLASPVVTFTNLTLQWFSTNQDLRIDSLVVRTYSADLPGGVLTTKFGADEIDALFGLTKSIVSHTSSELHPTIRHSSSATKGKASNGLDYAQCNFAFSLMPLPSPLPVQRSPLNVEIVLSGTALSPDGAMTAVSRTITSSIQDPENAHAVVNVLRLKPDHNQPRAMITTKRQD